MTREGLRNLEWVNLEEEKWAKIGRSHDGKITLKDVDIFLEVICQDMAHSLNMEQSELKEVVEADNIGFYKRLKNYKRKKLCWLNDENFRILKESFRVPKVPPINRMEVCKKLFNQLSPEEKLEILVEEMVTLAEVIKLETQEIERKNQ